MNRVLIVDDNGGNLYMLRALLQGNGYIVEEASHGAEALVKARQSPPTLIISDLLMPVMDGYTLLKQWKSDDRLKFIPFVVYTATYTDPKDERLALNLCADAFIIKPAEPESFMARIRDVLAKNARGELPGREASISDNVLLKDYSDVLLRKLEEKIIQLENANHALRDDIAERKRVEAELLLRERAIQAVSQGILITDLSGPDQPIIFASAGFERMTGYRMADVLGRNCRFLQGVGTDRETVGRMRAAIAAGEACSVEVLNYRRDGTAFWNALSLNPVFDESGTVTHYVGVQSDISARKSLEEQLRQSQKMEAVGQLAGGIAHDFNNLLTIISGYSEIMLLNPQMDDSMRESIDAIRKAGDRAASLTRQLLGFGRRTMLQPRTLNLNALVTETSKMLGRLIGEDILFSIVLDSKVKPIRVDPGQLDQVLINLVVNARDAMPKGGRLTVETSNVDLSDDYARAHIDSKAGSYVLLALTDTGCGMTPEILARVFEPFFTTKPVGKGTGLGLAMVFGIVQQSGGFIHVYSEPDRGSTFKIYFPAVTDASSQTVDAARKVEVGGTETILLVEDEVAVRGLACTSLEIHGYQVLSAADGKDALTVALAHQGSIDMVLTDVVMPNMSGPNLVEALRSQFPDIKVLYMSGYTDDAVVRHGILSADVAFIQKPYSPLALAQKVRQVLDGK